MTCSNRSRYASFPKFDASTTFVTLPIRRPEQHAEINKQAEQSLLQTVRLVANE